MNNLIEIKSSEIRIGPVLRDIYNSNGRLLIKQGFVIESNHQIRSLLSRGVFYSKNNYSKKDKPHPSNNFFTETVSNNPLTILENIASKLVLLFAAVTEKESNFTQKTMMIVDEIQLACDTNIDASLASILVLDGFSSSIKHSIDVAVLTEVIARKSAIEKQERRSMVAAALTMDLSTIELQEQLNQIDSLMGAEQKKSIFRHPEKSLHILEQAGVKDALWLKCVLEHHENKDGSGYPHHISAEQLSYHSQVISISNQYCARISPRGYREPTLHKNTLRQIFLDQGVKIDGKLEKLFIKQLGIYPLGSIVRLENQEIGQVFSQGKSLLTPIVYAQYKPGIGNYQRPVMRDTCQEGYEVIEVLKHGHKEITFDKKVIWGLEVERDKVEVLRDSSSTTNVPEVEGDNFKEIDAEIDALPTLPAVVSELMGLDISDENYFDKVQRLAENDPTFAIRLIRQANTVQNASLTQISSLEQAITRIGTRQIKGLITTFSIAKIFIPSNKSESSLWEHSVEVAVAARAIAAMDNQIQIDPEQAYLCGLLHDIGRFILFRIIPDGPVRTDEKNWKNPDQLVLAEQEACGLNHAELGSRACKKWGLPEDISVAIARHHDYKTYPNSSVPEQKLSQLTKVVQIADHLSMLLLSDSKFEILDLAEEDLYSVITENCMHSTWDNPPIDFRKLCDEMKNISDSADELIKELNLPT